MDDALTTPELNRLKWRCRRGLLENDILIERFWRRYEGSLTRRQATGLEALLELPDNDLLDLLLGRRAPTGELDRPEVNEVLSLLRTRQTVCDPCARP